MLNRFYASDNIHILKQLPDKIIDLTVTSPPYGTIRDYKGFTFNFEALADQLYRVTKVGGVVVWIVGDQTINGTESGESFRQALYFKEIGFNLHDTMIYQKGGFSFPDKFRYNPIFEYMFIFSIGRPKTINLIADKKNKYAGHINRSTDRLRDGRLVPNSGLKKGLQREVKEFGVRDNIWTYAVGWKNSSSDPLTFKHPATFPEKLAQDHIISWSKPSEIVLDPCCGSGTTCLMAYHLNRNFIGIDVSSEYINEICMPRFNKIKG